MPKTAKKRLKSRWTSEPILTKIKKPVESRLCGNLLWRGWPTFLEKKVEKQGKWGIMKTENAVNTVVEPYLWGIETIFCSFWQHYCTSWTVPMSDWNKTMCLKHLQSMRYTVSMSDWHILLLSFCIVLNLLRVTSYLWEMISFCWIYCFCMNISNASAHKELGHFWCTFPHFLIF